SPPIIVGLVLIGLGSGVFQAANAAATLAGVDSTQLGRTNAARITVQNTAYTSGVALGLTLVAAALPADLKAAVFEGAGASLRAGAEDQLAHGFAVAFAVAAALAISAVAISLLTRGPRPSPEA
ncbi:MAG: transporter, partial [Pseudonocardiales bacterium]|nr:transporter [Pseudonocardiales bacterium]